MNNDNKIQEIKDGYLDLVKAELSDYGIDQSKIFLNSQGEIEIEEHLLDLGVFVSFTDWSRPDMTLRGYTVDAGYIVFMPNREFYDEYRGSDILSEELEQHYKKAQQRVDELSQEYFSAIRELNDDKTLEERIPSFVSENLQKTESLSDIANWKVKVIIGNSIGRDGAQVGEMDSVGYTHIGLNTGTIVPVARGDEHHQGYDLIHYLMEKGLIPQDSYHPIFFNGDYVSGYDGVALQAMKTWRKLGGANIIIKNSSNNSGSPFQLTMDDYIKADGKIEITKGTLLPLGQEFINHLKNLSTKTTEYRNSLRGEKAVYVQTQRLLNFYQQKISQYSTKSLEETRALVSNAESIGGLDGLQKLEEAIFGFNGLKNQIHQEVRKALDPKAFSFQRDNIIAIFGDIDLANHELGSI